MIPSDHEPSESPVEGSDPTPVEAPLVPTSEPNPNAGVPLLQLSTELFDKIFADYSTIPDAFYINTHSLHDLSKFFERTDALTALSQTCRAMRDITLPRLWTRLDICRITDPVQISQWYETPIIMAALERKASGIAVSIVRQHVQTLTLLLSSHEPDAPLTALWNMLPKLPNLRKIQLLASACGTEVLKKTLGNAKLELPNVTTLFLEDGNAEFFQRICPNTTHIRCVAEFVEGSGGDLLLALTPKTERLDGMIDWRDLSLVDRLVANAPNLRTLEIRRPVDAELRIFSQDKAPAEWAQMIPKLVSLKHLAELVLTFPGEHEAADDAASIAAARMLMRTSRVAGPRRLVIRCVIAPHYVENDYITDFLQSSTTETFE
ncbi:hypothetical protein DFH07DRAFT_938232 [Mycena maculata]|uniref:F-box domain-containing protein n=1 Tax=Mycena maculata TaxID=230809 RepID=A0AAD7JUB9_9AGAR|nr:hypothetical protein DFH07DRAFT_938232 [Mycena maculata]